MKKRNRLGRLKSRVFNFVAAVAFAVSTLSPMCCAEEFKVDEPDIPVVIETAQIEYDAPAEEVEEPVEEVIDEMVPEPEPEPVVLPYSNAEIELIARIAWCEAGNQPEKGIRWIIDGILNRVDDPRFPNTVHDVIFAKNPVQFSCTVDGAYEKSFVRDDIYQYVIEEITGPRDSYEVLTWRTGHYHNWGYPIAKIGDHYFGGV